jgi:outer membrane protein assembly factor BamD
MLRSRPGVVRYASAASAFAALALAGCSSTNQASKLLNPDPPGKMYAQADSYLTRGRYEDAAHKFEDLDRDHPYSQEARRAIVMSAFAYYKAQKFPEAIATAKRYTTMHPGTKEAPLAHHIIASSYFDDMNGPNRDQTNTRKALEEYKTLIARYPDSSYARDADNRIRICEDSLAAHEMLVARAYLKDRKLLAAKNRFEVVAREYQTTAHVEEALYRLVEVNLALGIVQEAQTAAAVLGHNFPQSRWYKDSYALLQKGGLAPQNHGGNWLSRAWQNVKLPKLSLGQ